jgi:tripartite-type tricarboxylate transporter receptor subunit TctC
MMTRWFQSAATIALLMTGAAAQAADAYPARTITLIVPFPAGGPSDSLARTVSQVMSRELKQSIVIENVSGASGTIGLTRMIKSDPDGYTLGFGTIGTHVANVALFKKLPYDPVADFEPIGLAGTAPTLLVAKTALPVSNLKEFVAYAEANKAAMTYGSAGVGSISHYACVILLSTLKLNVTHASYRGVAPAMNDLMGGHIDFMCDQSTTALPQVQGGKIKAIAVLTKQKLPQLRDTGTAAAAGYGDVDIRAWNALFVPKGTPASIIKRINDALRAAVGDAELKKQLDTVGVDLPAAAQLTPETVSALIADGLKRDVPALRARGEFLD